LTRPAIFYNMHYCRTSNVRRLQIHISARLQLFSLKEQDSFVGNEGKGSCPRSLGNGDGQYFFVELSGDKKLENGTYV